MRRTVNANFIETWFRRLGIPSGTGRRGVLPIRGQNYNHMKHFIRSMLLWLLLGPTLIHAAEENYFIDIPPGLSLIANQLDKGGNTLNDIMPVVPDRSAIKLQDRDGKLVDLATYSKENATWTPNN